MDTRVWSLPCSRFSQKVFLRTSSLGLSGSLARQHCAAAQTAIAIDAVFYHICKLATAGSMAGQNRKGDTN